jgi:ketosteroid isomerase-like protein
MRSKLFLMGAAAVVLAACEKPAAGGMAESGAHTDSVKAGISTMNSQFAAHMKAGHTDSIVAMYADNASLMPPNMPAAHGTAAIKTAMTGMMAEGLPTEFTLTSDEVTVAGDMAIERGHYKFGMMGPNHMAMSDSGSYLVHWHKMGSDWKIVDDIWNSSNPPMAMPAAPRRHS